MTTRRQFVSVLPAESASTTVEDTNGGKNYRSEIIQKLPGFLTVTNKLEKTKLSVCLKVDRRRDETETYSPGSSKLPSGCNSIWAAFPTSLVVLEI
jgi:hypothetical protein